MDKVEHKNEALENTSQLFHIPVNNSLANWVYVMEINNKFGFLTRSEHNRTGSKLRREVSPIFKP